MNHLAFYSHFETAFELEESETFVCFVNHERQSHAAAISVLFYKDDEDGKTDGSLIIRQYKYLRPFSLQSFDDQENNWKKKKLVEFKVDDAMKNILNLNRELLSE